MRLEDLVAGIFARRERARPNPDVPRPKDPQRSEADEARARDLVDRLRGLDDETLAKYCTDVLNVGPPKPCTCSICTTKGGRRGDS